MTNQISFEVARWLLSEFLNRMGKKGEPKEKKINAVQAALHDFLEVAKTQDPEKINEYFTRGIEGKLIQLDRPFFKKIHLGIKKKD